MTLYCVSSRHVLDYRGYKIGNKGAISKYHNRATKEGAIQFYLDTWDLDPFEFMVNCSGYVMVVFDASDFKADEPFVEATVVAIEDLG